MGPGIVGDLNAWVQAAEEQGRGTLHAHWQLFTKQLSNKARADLFHTDKDIRDNARRELADYIDNMICASYGSDIELTHACNEHVHRTNNIGASETLDNNAKADAPKDVKLIQRHVQTFRDARHKVLCNRIEGELIICRDCDGFLRSDDIIEDFYRRKSSKKRVRKPLFVCSSTIAVFFPAHQEFLPPSNSHSAHVCQKAVPSPPVKSHRSIKGTLLRTPTHMTCTDVEPYTISSGVIRPSEWLSQSRGWNTTTHSIVWRVSRINANAGPCFRNCHIDKRQLTKIPVRELWHSNNWWKRIHC